MDYERAKEFREIFAGLSRRQKFAAAFLNRKVFVGERTRSGWSGFLPFYLFKCPACGELSCDYPHGYFDYRNLICHRCGATVDFIPWWAPLAELREMWVARKMFAKIKKRA